MIDAGTAIRCLDDETAVVTQPENWEARIHAVSTRANDASRMLDELRYQLQVERSTVARTDEEDK